MGAMAQQLIQGQVPGQAGSSPATPSLNLPPQPSSAKSAAPPAPGAIMNPTSLPALFGPAVTGLSSGIGQSAASSNSGSLGSKLGSMFSGGGGAGAAALETAAV